MITRKMTAKDGNVMNTLTLMIISFGVNGFLAKSLDTN